MIKMVINIIIDSQHTLKLNLKRFSKKRLKNDDPKKKLP